MWKYLSIALLVTPAFAQPQTPTEQVLSAKIMTEMSLSLQCQVSVLELKKRVAELEEQVKKQEAPK